MSDKYIEWEDFKKVEIKTGTIVEVLDFPEAIKPAYKIKVDLFFSWFSFLIYLLFLLFFYN